MIADLNSSASIFGLIIDVVGDYGSLEFIIQLKRCIIVDRVFNENYYFFIFEMTNHL